MLTMNSMPLNTHSKCLNIGERDSDVGYVVFTQQGKSKIVIDDSVFEIKRQFDNARRRETFSWACGCHIPRTIVAYLLLVAG